MRSSRCSTSSRKRRSFRLEFEGLTSAKPGSSDGPHLPRNVPARSNIETLLLPILRLIASAPFERQTETIMGNISGVSPTATYTKFFRNDFNFAAGSTRSAVGATAPSPTRAAVQMPSSTVRLTPMPTTAMSISVRGIMRR